MGPLGGRQPIDMAIAKSELERINDLLDVSLTLIGGLAVQQYVTSRVSRDIDLICDFETASRLLRLYPSKDWDVTNDQSEYRPNFVIRHRVTGLTVYFGPKILEREEYPGVRWSDLSKDTSPFKKELKPLPNIQVPPAHALAYAKIISFLDRYIDKDKKRKAIVDLEDFIDLTNCKQFSLSELYTLIRKHKTENDIEEKFAAIVKHDALIKEKLADSCLAYFSRIWIDPSNGTPSVSTIPSRKRSARFYLSSPHLKETENDLLARALREAGFNPIIPYEEVKRVCGTASPGKERAKDVRNACVGGILSADALVVDVDLYGLDSAWEMGFAEGLSKSLFGVNRDVALKYAPRSINRRPYSENFMHGWDEQKIFDNFRSILTEYPEEAIYICCPFKNPALRTLKNATRKRIAKIIFPEEYIPVAKLPRDYPLSTRTNAINQMNECAVMVVVLPRYGMDAAWQIGYATAKGKKIVGLMASDDNEHEKFEMPFDHWMHGWREKDIFTGEGKLCAALGGYHQAGLV